MNPSDKLKNFSFSVTPLSSSFGLMSLTYVAYRAVSFFYPAPAHDALNEFIALVVRKFFLNIDPPVLRVCNYFSGV